MDVEGSIYRNLISHIDINRGVNSIEYITFRDINDELVFKEFLSDINVSNDTIELNLINNKAYKEAVIMSLHMDPREKHILVRMIKEEQKTFGGSKLFYLNDMFDKILVVSVPRSMEGKLNMVINRLNKINERISRLNSRIKKENLEIYKKREVKDKKDIIVDMINRNLRV
ncbi:MAG: hypothetical protein IIB81_03480 [Nanoarchaeota archaeon]|nr:hypothetical protein [Nanoarchaeota archaeon]